MMGVTEGIVIGTVSGVIAGVVVSILLWVKHAIDAWCNRRKEIKRLRDIIEDGRNKMYRETNSQDENRAKEYRLKMPLYYMVKQLYNALDRGSLNLSYDETQGVRDAISIYYKDILDSSQWIGFEEYKKMFEDLEKLKWLKLSARSDRWPQS